MRLRAWRPPPLAEWPMTAIPWINVALLLIGVVVLAPQMVTTAGMPLALPRAVTAEAVGGAGIVITVTAQQLIYLNDRLTTLDDLPAQLTPLVAAGPTTTVLIRSDQQVPVATITRLWDLCRQLGVTKIAMATTKATP